MVKFSCVTATDKGAWRYLIRLSMASHGILSAVSSSVSVLNFFENDDREDQWIVNSLQDLPKISFKANLSIVV
jgi:hypothetical protein